MADPKSTPAAGDRIRWKGDEEAARGSRQGLQRSASNGSLSIHSIHSRRNSFDPAAELPIQYRTM
jgi:sodium/potassium-transporting ATPase subunit alpha